MKKYFSKYVIIFPEPSDIVDVQIGQDSILWYDLEGEQHSEAFDDAGREEDNDLE